MAEIAQILKGRSVKIPVIGARTVDSFYWSHGINLNKDDIVHDLSGSNGE